MAFYSHDYLVKKVKNQENQEILKILRKKTGHQYPLKISLRIEWDHSQPLKITRKHSNLHP